MICQVSTKKEHDRKIINTKRFWNVKDVNQVNKDARFGVRLRK